MRELHRSRARIAAGTAVLDEGAAITNTRDRLAAIGGDGDSASTPAVGTLVRGRAPSR
jgi:hypothetical protein